MEMGSYIHEVTCNITIYLLTLCTGFGLACHLGVLSGIPTIGVGKTLLYVDGLTKQTVRAQFANECKKGGDYSKLIGTSGQCWGAVCVP